MRIPLTLGLVLVSFLFTSTAAQKRVLVDCVYSSLAPCADLTNEQSTPLQWEVGSESTGSQGTGPTNGINDKYYTFIETSNKNLNDYANLMSNALGVTGDVCLDFYYHMYGEEMGTLNVAVRSASGDDQVVFTKSGDQGDTWFHQTMTLSSLSQTDKIIFNGIRGNGYRGDIALDEIKITTLSCDDNSQVATTLPSTTETLLPLTCNFDSKDAYCGISQGVDDVDDEYDWAILTDATPSTDTGPTRGYAGSNGYIYAEATSQSTGDNARFSLPPLFSSGRMSCVKVEFYYHMYGAHMGDLKVYVGSNMMFEKKGDQGNNWFKASFQSSMTSDQLVTFEAIRGNEYGSDIAVDAIKVTNCGGNITTVPTVPTTTVSSGSAGLPYTCTFETNCSISQDTNDDSNWLFTTSGTPSSSTGPSSGYGGGRFIFYEATNEDSGNKARFTLPALVTSGSLSCATVKFYYYMYGSSLGTLNVYTRQGSDQSNAQVKFTVSGDKGQNWLETSFTTSMDTNTFVRSLSMELMLSGPNSDDCQIVFEAVRGSGFESDIAVDSITVTDCSGSGGATTMPPASTPRPTNPSNVPYKVRLQPYAVWVTQNYPAQLTCGVDDPEYINPFNLSLAWYFPNGSRIVGDATTPGFRYNYVYSANVSITSLGWWKTTLFVDSLDYTMSGDYTCKVNYAAYPATIKTSSLFFQGCPAGYYSCPRSEGCVPCSVLCDGLNDCGDWSDEFKCGGLHVSNFRFRQCRKSVRIRGCIMGLPERVDVVTNRLSSAQSSCMLDKELKGKGAIELKHEVLTRDPPKAKSAFINAVY
ncbi:hypothetical protein CAPTEDRAFT_223844 [Capitella teleta]|uniref:MAM domain-containing protein n=1 Tax=Capitella teleta TaxID=283909 RepID=R7TWE8_CAPTE|nr:hypothetical protein CAPTEDRAFT_223844 [Capitella teleta]|eukprot:ELT98074.1 hypothetical protein CAPTEDRAFT_223844 [Capitella teleta]